MCGSLVEVCDKLRHVGGTICGYSGCDRWKVDFIDIRVIDSHNDIAFKVETAEKEDNENRTRDKVGR